MNVVSPATKLLLALSVLRGVGPATLKKVVLIPGFLNLPIEQLAKNIPPIDRALSETGDAWVIAQEEAVKQIDQAEKNSARIISAIDSEYPSLLAATKDDPFILYVQGSLFTNSERSVAIIGTREPTTHGHIIAERITQFFAEHSWSVVSGLAIGCDAIAHKAALNVGAHTVAVMAHGLHMTAPSKHKKLAQDILEAGGALISEYPFGQNVQNQQYVKRDRTQAGMAQGVVMIQSDLKGGSLHASRAALDYGRWLAVPYPTEKDRGIGEPKVQANLLVADGSEEQKTALMRCKKDDLRRVIILRSREDYFRLIGSKENLTSSYGLPNSLKGSPTESVAPSENPITLSSNNGEWDSHEYSLLRDEDKITKNLSTFATKNFNSIALPDKRSLNCRIILCKNNPTYPEIEHLLPTTLATLKKQKNFIEGHKDIVTLSARIRYIQLKVIEIVEMTCNNSANTESDNNFTAQFSIEELLIHMKKSAETLSLLRTDAVPEMGNQQRVIDNTKGDYLFNSFNTLMSFINYSVIFKNDVNSLNDAIESETHTNKAIDVRLDNLIVSFNSLIRQINTELSD